MDVVRVVALDDAVALVVLVRVGAVRREAVREPILPAVNVRAVVIGQRAILRQPEQGARVSEPVRDARVVTATLAERGVALAKLRAGRVTRENDFLEECERRGE